MTFVSIRMAQKSGKWHFCSIQYRKLCDGKQHVMVFLKVLWDANKCIASDVRIHLFFGHKNDVCVKSDGSKIGEIRTFAVYSNGSSAMESNTARCFSKYSGMPTSVSRQIFEFIFSLVKKMTFVSKGMAQKSNRTFAM